MSRNVRIVVVVVAAVAVAVAIVVSVVQGSSTGSPLDNGLKSSGEKLAGRLHQPDKPYAQEGSFLNAFNLFQHSQQVTLDHAANVLSKDQFAQIAVYETKTMPPVFRALQMRGKPPISVDGTVISQVAGGKTVTTTIHQGNLQFRGYLMPVTVPPTLADGGTKEVLEVFQVQPT